MNDCYLGLGGNVGDVVATMDAALDRLDAHPQIAVTRVSRVYETAPVGANAGDRFLNAAVEVKTNLDPAELLNELKRTEQALGRIPGDRWTERLIDIDLLLFGSTVSEDSRLIVPHPQMWYRRFVLDPLVEIATDVIHPQYNTSLNDLRNQVLKRPLELVLIGGHAESREVASAVLKTYRPLVNLNAVAVSAESHVRSSPAENRSLSLGFPESSEAGSTCHLVVDLATIPGGLEDAVASVMAAVLDDPVVQSRPLRRMP